MDHFHDPLAPFTNVIPWSFFLIGIPYLIIAYIFLTKPFQLLASFPFIKETFMTCYEAPLYMLNFKGFLVIYGLGLILLTAGYYFLRDKKYNRLPSFPPVYHPERK